MCGNKLFRIFLQIIFLTLKEKKLYFTTVGSPISKWPPPNLTSVNISTSNCRSNMILVPKPMFSWSKTSMRVFLNL